MRFVLTLVLVAALPVGAQSSSTCWLRSGPLDRCRNFLVTEAAVEIPFFTTDRAISAGTREADFDTRFLLSVGWMRNYAADRAAGIVLGHDVNRGWNLPTRAEARHRWWKGSLAADVSAGLTHRGMPDAAPHAWGLTTAIGGEWRYIGADARLDLMRSNRTVAAGFVGARATSAGAPVATLIAIGVLFAVVASTQ